MCLKSYHQQANMSGITYNDYPSAEHVIDPQRKGFDADKFVKSIGFAKPVEDEYGGFRINNGISHPDGKNTGIFLKPPPGLFCFGVNYSDKFKTPMWSHSMSLLDKENPTKEQYAFVELLNKIVERQFQHVQQLIDNDELSVEYIGTLEAAKQGVVSYPSIKKKDGTRSKKIDYSKTPCLYSKLQCSREKGKRRDIFRDVEDNPLSYEDMRDKYHEMVACVIKISYPYVGGKKPFVVRIDLWEAVVNIIDHSSSRLLSAPSREDSLLSSRVKELSVASKEIEDDPVKSEKEVPAEPEKDPMHSGDLALSDEE